MSSGVEFAAIRGKHILDPLRITTAGKGNHEAVYYANQVFPEISLGISIFSPS